MSKYLLIIALSLYGCSEPALTGIGGPCEKDTDCEYGRCKLENQGVKFTGGVCTKSCVTQEDCEHPLGMCLIGSVGEEDFCMQGCLGFWYDRTLSDEEKADFSDCREEYSCRDVWYGNYICWPD